LWDRFELALKFFIPSLDFDSLGGGFEIQNPERE